MNEEQTIYRDVDTANDRYTIVDNENVIERNELSWEARGLLIYLLSKPKHWRVRRGDLVNQSPAGESVVRRILGELRDHGYLRYKEQTQDDTGRFMWITTVHDRPLGGPPNPERRTYEGYISAENKKSTGGKSTGGKPTSRKSTGGESTGGKPATLVSTEVATTEGPSTEGTNTDVAASDGSASSNGDSIGYTDAFEEMWSVYPRQISKKNTFRVWNTRIEQGAKPEDMISAAKNYAKEAKRERTGSKFLKYPATFFGPDEHFLDYVATPPKLDGRRHNVTEDRDGESGEVEIASLFGDSWDDEATDE